MSYLFNEGKKIKGRRKQKGKQEKKEELLENMPNPHLNIFLLSVRVNKMKKQTTTGGGGKKPYQLKCHDLLLCRCQLDFTEMAQNFDFLIRKKCLFPLPDLTDKNTLCVTLHILILCLTVLETHAKNILCALPQNVVMNY